MSICPDCLQCADCGAWYGCLSEPGTPNTCPQCHPNEKANDA